jgi:hypothetical protein
MITVYVISAQLSCLSKQGHSLRPLFILLVGHSPLSWIMRVQIALDAARGLEYIHEHTKAHYVHRDIKTSNILLDASFKAKVMNNLYSITYFLYVSHMLIIICHRSLFVSLDFRFWIGETCRDNKRGGCFNYQSCWYIWISCSGVSNVH